MRCWVYCGLRFQLSAEPRQDFQETWTSFLSSLDSRVWSAENSQVRADGRCEVHRGLLEGRDAFPPSPGSVARGWLPCGRRLQERRAPNLNGNETISAETCQLPQHLQQPQGTAASASCCHCCTNSALHGHHQHMGLCFLGF